MDYTPRLRIALETARQSLSRFNHSRVSSVHLLLGLMTLKQGVSVNLLRRFGLGLEHIENSLVVPDAAIEPPTVWEGIPCAGSAVSALQRAAREAKRFDHTYVGTEHVLLGIASEENGPVAELLRSRQIDPERLRAEVERELSPR